MAQTTLVDLNAPTQNAAAVAAHLSSLPGAPAAAAAAAQAAAPLGDAGDFAGFAAALLAAPARALLFHDGLSDAEVEGVMAWMSALVMSRVPAGAERDALVANIGEVATESEARSALRLRVIVSLFNLLPSSATRFATFERLLNYSMHTGNVAFITSYLSSIDMHMKSWGAGTSDEDAQRLLVSSYRALLKAGEDQAAQGALVKYLASFENADAATLSSIKELAEAAIVGAVQSPLTESNRRSGVDQAGILGYAAVRQLKGEPLYELLEIFAGGEVKKFRAFFAEHASMTEARGLSLERGLENTRLLSVCALASNERELSYTKIATALEVEDASVEEWVIKAVTADLIEAQIDQLRRVIVIDRATPRFFGAKHWEGLSSKLQAWRTNVRQLLEVIQNAKKQRSAMHEHRRATAATLAAKGKA